MSQGTVCDVRNGKDVKALVEFARDKLKHIDIWVCIDFFPHKITACALIFTVVLSGIETWNCLQQNDTDIYCIISARPFLNQVHEILNITAACLWHTSALGTSFSFLIDCSSFVKGENKMKSAPLGSV